MTAPPNPTSDKSSKLVNTAGSGKVRGDGSARENLRLLPHWGGRISLSKVLMRARGIFEELRNHFRHSQLCFDSL